MTIAKQTPVSFARRCAVMHTLQRGSVHTRMSGTVNTTVNAAQSRVWGMSHETAAAVYIPVSHCIADVRMAPCDRIVWRTLAT